MGLFIERGESVWRDITLYGEGKVSWVNTLELKLKVRVQQKK